MPLTSVFFYQIMKFNVTKSTLKYFSPLLFMILMMSCEKKYQRPDHYEIDLFADERQEGKAYVMNPEECYNASAMVIASHEVKLVDSSSGRGKSFFIYKVNSGKIMKTTRDSAVQYPLQFLSEQKLKLKKDSIYVYLEKLEGYRFIAEEMELKYQWLRGAPVYSVKESK